MSNTHIYSLNFRHFTPKDSETGHICFVIANNDEQILDWLNTDPSNLGINGNWVLGWKDNLEEEIELVVDLYQDEKNEYISKFWKSKLDNRGDIDNDDVRIGNPYYGATLYGWKLLKKNVNPNDYKNLEELNCLYNLTK